MKDLKTRWGLFFDVIGDPWNVLLIISLAILSYNSVNQANVLVSTLLFILITVASAILGGRIAKHWADITEVSIVSARGHAAVRNLKLLLRLVTALEKRVTVFRIREEDILNQPEVTKRNYEEAIETCKQIQEQTVNSIENWTDIVPEADIKTEIGVISDLKDSLNAKEEDLKLLKNQIQKDEGKTGKEFSDMKKQIIAKEIQIAELTSQIRNKDRSMGLGGLGLLDSTPFLNTSTHRLSELVTGRSRGLINSDPKGGLNTNKLSVTDVTHGSTPIAK